MDITTIDIDYLTRVITLIIGAATVLGLLWRYLITPLLKLLKNLRINSDKISDAFPILFELSRLFPEASSPGSLKAFFDETLVNKTWIRVLIEVFNIAAFETSADGSCTWTSDRWQELTGISLDDSLGDGWVTGIAPEDRDRVYKEWKSSVRDKRMFEIQYSIYNGSKDLRTTIRGNGLAVRDSEHNVIKYLGMLIEVNHVDNKFSKSACHVDL